MGSGSSWTSKISFNSARKAKQYPWRKNRGIDSLAHSGAPIGAHESIDTNDPIRSLHGEVPRPQPTIRELVNMFTGNPRDVDLVLIDGCLDDITSEGVTAPEPLPEGIAGPLAMGFKDITMRLQFRQEIYEKCHDDMKILLQEVASKFSNPETRIVVTGYY